MSTRCSSLLAVFVDVPMGAKTPRFRWLFCPSRNIGNSCRFLGLNWQEVITTFLSLTYVAKYAQGMATSNEANGIQLLYDGDGLAVIGEPSSRLLKTDATRTI